jgi:hypothetical protein
VRRVLVPRVGKAPLGTRRCSRQGRDWPLSAIVQCRRARHDRKHRRRAGRRSRNNTRITTVVPMHGRLQHGLRIARLQWDSCLYHLQDSYIAYSKWDSRCGADRELVMWVLLRASVLRVY